MARRTRVLLVRPNRSSFMDQDEVLLRRHYDVRTLDMYAIPRGGLYAPRFLVRLSRDVLWADVVVSWFADRHSATAGLLSRMLGAKCVVIVGGYEAAKVPEIGYGSLLSDKGARTVGKALRRAHLVLAVSEFTKQELESNLNFSGAKVVYNCVGPDFVPGDAPKERLVVMVANTLSSTRRLKGLDTFAQASALVPDARFVLVGPNDEETAEALKVMAPSLEITGQVTHDEVVAWMKRANVYCQTSYRESFGIAVAEAMACACVPVVTKGGALPEVVGDTGFYVEYGDAKATAEAITHALRSDKGPKARERVQGMFSMERRESALTTVIDSLAAE